MSGHGSTLRAFLSAFVLAAACGGGGGTPTPASSPGPVQVQVRVDSARTGRATLPLTGGTVTVTAADGIRYLLTIPADALLAEVEIAMTPIVAVDGFRTVDAHVAGVRLEPEGLRFHHFARLEVLLPTPGNRGARAYSCDGTCTELHAYPLDPGPATLSLPLLHFSDRIVVYGETTLLPAAPVPPENLTPEEWEARFEQELQFYLQSKRAAALLNQPMGAEFWDTLADAQRAYYDRIVAALLPGIASSCSAFRRDAPKALVWARWVNFIETSGRLDPQQTAVKSAFQAGIANCWSELTATCYDPGDLDRVLAINTVARQAALEGLTTVDPAAARPCGATWSGTSSCTTASGDTLTATVTWSLATSGAGVEQYAPAGTAVLTPGFAASMGCTASPLTYDIDSGAGQLLIDRNVNPALWSGFGSLLLRDAAMVCPDGTSAPYPVALDWLVGDGPITAGALIQGTTDLPGESCRHTFSR